MQPKQAQPAPQPTVKVPVTTSFSPTIYKRLEKYTNEKGLDRVQDAVRIALAKFLDSEGY